MKILEGKTAIVTGASSGIGKAASMIFARAGATVVVIARRAELLDRLVDEIAANGGRAMAVVGDVCDEQTHRVAIQVARRQFGGLHVAFNNAGIVGANKPTAEITLEDWSDVLKVNLTAAFLGAREQISEMLASGGGSIIFTGSFVGSSVGIPGMTAFAAAKAGLMGLVRGITAEYGASNIRANALLSGGVATALAGNAEQREWAANLHAMKRLAEPEEIASAALFLASDAASFVTGSALWADGGNSAVK